MAVREPSWSTTDPKELLLGQLSYYRGTLLAKLGGLSEEELRTSLLPSGWVPLALLKHLAYVERRWMQWGFAAEPVSNPWGDDDPVTTRWRLRPEETLVTLTAFLGDTARRTGEIAARAPLEARGRLGGRFESEAPTLGWILVHLVQEYARHVGHLDVVRELINGSTGE